VFSDPDLSENSFDLIGQAPFLKERLIVPTMTDADGNLTDIGKQFYKVFDQEHYISKFSTRVRLV